MKQLTKEQAIAFHDSKIWEDWPLDKLAKFQMVQDKLCIPFGKFHEAIEKTLDRPVFTHEFGLNCDGIMKELFDGAPRPTFEEIMELIPEDKRIIIGL